MVAAGGPRYEVIYGSVGVTITAYVSGSAVGGAQVALINESGDIVATGITGSDGKIAFYVVPGNYTIEATYESDSTTYGYSSSNSFAVDESGSQQSITLTRQNTYDHVDIEVSGAYTLKLDDGTEVSLKTYVYDGSSIQVTLPDGTVLEGKAEYSNTDSQIEYRYTNLSVSAQWDGATYSGSTTYLNGSFTLSGYILISVEEVTNSGLSAEQINSIFGSYETMTVTSGDSSSVSAGTYYIIPFSDYHPEYNVCIGSSGGQGASRGYDFEIDMNQLLMALSDKLVVLKYVIDEEGNIISAETDNTSFTFTLNTSDGSYVESTQLTSGGSYTFENIERGYYYVEETAVGKYVPVTVKKDENGNIVLSESGYIQYVQTEKKEDGTVASVTYYNLKLEDLGTAKLQKVVDDGSVEKSYSKDTFTFKLYTEENGTYTASSLNDITITTDESKEFYLTDGTYTIVELASDLTEKDSQTVSLNGTELTREVANESDPYGLSEGTIYYVGTITIKSGESLTYTVTNTYSSNIDVIIKKVSNDNMPVALEGAKFTLTESGATESTSYSTLNDGTITISGLTNGTYTLKETVAPDGYNLLNGTITLTIGNGAVTADYNGTDGNKVESTTIDGSIVITVTNTAGSALPETGGPGTTPFRIAGLLLTSCSAYLIYETLRRRRNYLK